MSYRTNKNYTLIEELPDLEELERGNQNYNGGGINMIPPDNANQINKFIRNNVYEPPVESGMAQPQRPPQRQNQHHQPQPQSQPPPEQTQITQFIIPPPPPQNQFMEDSMYEPNFNQPPMRYNPHHNYDINCVSVADHTTNCIVCSRLYQHNTSGYIVVIILLSIICILLLKRVLNV
jgi:hypothetical protein